MFSANVEQKFYLDATVTPREEKTLMGHKDKISALVVLSSGQLVSGSSDKTIKLWNASTGQCEKTLTGHTQGVTALVVLPKDLLVSGSSDKTIKLWNVNTGQCEKTLKDHTGGVYALAILPNGQLVSSDGRTIKLWAVPRWGRWSQLWCEKTLDCGFDALVALPGGLLASISGVSQIIGLLNVDEWQFKGSMGVEYEDGHNIINLVALPNTGQLASRHSNGMIQVWSVHGSRPEKQLSGHYSNSYNRESLIRGAGRALVALPSGQLASGGDGEIKLWNVSTGRCEKTLTGHGDMVSALVVLPSGQLASGSWDNTIRLWDVGLRLVPSVVTQLEPLSVANATHESAHSSHNSVESAAFNAFSNECSINAAVESFEKVAIAPTPIIPPNHSSIAETILFSELALGKELGRGGFGVVCEALWNGVTQVAVKQLLSQLTSEHIDEFHRETAVHARLRHPNIVALYGICVEAAKYAMVVEFMANGSLYDVLKSSADLTWSMRLKMSLDITSGLLYLHSKQIIHRDLKSLNILVDGQMCAKISDFGLAKIKHTSATMTKGGMGSLYWMAPELFEDDAVCNQATDVYATGVVLWEISSRKLPYENKNQAQILRNVEKGIRETIPSDTPSKLSALITRCWAQRAEDRPVMNNVVREMREMQSNDNASVFSGYQVFSKR